jgi:hypothetical protein
MRGTGAAAYVKLIQDLYQLAEIPSIEEDHTPSKFFESDTMRKLIYGYLCRWRRNMSYCCPVCPQVWNSQFSMWVNGCKGYIIDAKVLRIDLNEDIEAAHSYKKDDTEVKRTQYLVRNQITFLPGDELNESRYLIRSMCGSITKQGYTNMLKLTGNDLRLDALKVPECYHHHVVVILEAFKLLDLNNDNESQLFINGETEVNRTLVFYLAVVFYNICHDSCVATQYVCEAECRVLQQLLDKTSFNGDYIQHLRKTLRNNLFDLVSKCSIATKDGFELHPLVSSLFNGFVDAVVYYRKKALMCEKRSLIAPENQTSPDASTGVWTSFSSKNVKIAKWPYWDKRKSQRVIKNLLKKIGYEQCEKPSWQKKKLHGKSEGLFTFMCPFSGVVIASTFLSDHEGRDTALAALYCYHPSPKVIEFIISDTACMHAVFTAIRTGEFSHIRWVLDRFHAGGHNCKGIYSTSNYKEFENLNDSIIEQYHASIDCLEQSFFNTKLASACMILQHFNYDLMLEMMKKKNIPQENINWRDDTPSESQVPEATTLAEVPTTSSNSNLTAEVPTTYSASNVIAEVAASLDPLSFVLLSNRNRVPSTNSVPLNPNIHIPSTSSSGSSTSSISSSDIRITDLLSLPNQLGVASSLNAVFQVLRSIKVTYMM